MLAAPLAMSAPILGASPARAATTGVLSPAAGTVITSGSQVTARAHFDLALTMQLRYDGPGRSGVLLAEKSLWGDLSGSIPISRNGQYRVFLKGKQTGLSYGEVHPFTVRIPPAAPSGVSARVSSGKLVVRWKRGGEQDLTGYTLSGAGAGSASGSVGSMCSGANCTATLSLTRSSGSVSVGVRAKRSTGTGGSISSGATTAGAFVSSGKTGTVPHGSAPSLSSGATRSNSSAPLTPFNNESPVTLPSVQPDGATPGFTYPTPQIADAPKAQKVAGTDRLQWGRSVAIALVLLVAAAHLGTWTRRMRVHQAGTSSLGMAARIARGGTGRTRVRAARERIARAEALAKTGPVQAVAVRHEGVRSRPGGRRRPPAEKKPADVAEPTGTKGRARRT